MTDKEEAQEARDTFWAGALGAFREIGLGKVLAGLTGVIVAVFTLGTLLGARTALEGIRAVEDVNTRQDSALVAHGSTLTTHGQTLDSLRALDLQSLAAAVEEIRLNTCLTLIEVRRDANTDRCRP